MSVSTNLTLSDLFLVIIFFLLVAIMVLFIVFMVNLIAFVRSAQRVISENETNFKSVLNDLPGIVRDIRKMTDDAKDDMSYIKKLFIPGSHVDLDYRMRDSKRDTFSKLNVILDIVDFVRNMFISDKEKDDECNVNEKDISEE
jgi:hypothetical protein